MTTYIYIHTNTDPHGGPVVHIYVYINMYVYIYINIYTRSPRGLGVQHGGSVADGF